MPSALLVDGNTAWTSVDGPSIRSPDMYANVRNDARGPVHGPGMQMTFGAMLRLRFENVCDPEQPLKLCPTVIAVTFSSGEIVKAIELPWDVVHAWEEPYIPAGGQIAWWAPRGVRAARSGSLAGAR